MAHKAQDSFSDDDAPEAISHSTSKADLKRSQKALHDFEAEEKARRKARNRERDRKLKERARVTKGGKTGEKLRRVRFMDQTLEGGSSGGDEGDDDDDVEARMLRAMRDAADEMESDDDDDGEFKGFGQGMDLGDSDMASESDSSFAQEDDDGTEMSLWESDSMDPETPTDDEEMDEDKDEEITPFNANIRKPSRKANYLADDLFAAAFASQNSKPPNENIGSIQQHTTRKRRRKSTARPKDLVIGGRTIRMLPRPSDPRSQATARCVPSAHARKFVDQSLAMKGKQALLKAKKKGWERRLVNVGVMKYQGAPHGFARITR